MLFDLDGVCRDLDKAIWGVKGADDWDQPCPNGQNIFDFVADNLDILLKCPPTKYCDLIRTYNPIILSSQPETWRPNTTKWIEKYMPECSKIIYVSKPEEKLPYFYKTKNWIVEDYPKFDPDVYLNNLILIDTKFNQSVKAKYRVDNEYQLFMLLEFINYG